METLMKKEEFLDCMDFIKKQRQKQDKFIEGLEALTDNTEYCNCFCYFGYEERYLQLIEKLMNDKDQDIRYFMYDMDFGETLFDEALYTNEEELYNYIKRKNEVTNIGIYRFEILSAIDKEIESFCKINNIMIISENTLLIFVSTAENLQKLHDKYFKEFSFKIERVF